MNPKTLGPPRNRHERRRVAAESRRAARALAKAQAQRAKRRWSKASWTITTNSAGFALLEDGSFWATPLPTITTTSMPCTPFAPRSPGSMRRVIDAFDLHYVNVDRDGSFSIAGVVKAEHEEDATTGSTHE